MPWEPTESCSLETSPSSLSEAGPEASAAPALAHVSETLLAHLIPVHVRPPPPGTFQKGSCAGAPLPWSSPPRGPRPEEQESVPLPSARTHAGPGSTPGLQGGAGVPQRSPEVQMQGPPEPDPGPLPSPLAPAPTTPRVVAGAAAQGLPSQSLDLRERRWSRGS